MKTFANNFGNRALRTRVIPLFLLLIFATFQSALAVTDYIFFSVNGDTSLNTMVQGDTVGWGSNCDLGATLIWEIWLDTDLNSDIDSLTDRRIALFSAADGDTTSNSGLPDISPVPDGWYIIQPLILGIAPGYYIFRVTNMTDNSIAQRGMASTPLPSPPNIFRGHVTVEGHPAPDPVYLRNIWIEANLDPDESQMWSGLTDENGLYEINIGDVGTGFPFRITPVNIPGYITPPSQTLTASGIIDSVNFAYTAPTDSLYGQIKDQNDILIIRPVYAGCSPRFAGPSERYILALNGTYAVYFSPSEYGLWSGNINGEDLYPDYISPYGFEFDNDTLHTIRHDFVCYTADTIIYARVTEAGGPPAHRYMIAAQSNHLQSGTQAPSDTGSANLATLHISSADTSGWNFSVANWDSNYPIPPGYVLDNSSNFNYHPGDTANLNFIYGKMVRDTVTLDPGDSPIDWNALWVNMNNGGPSYGGSADSNGVYTVYADTGIYNLQIHYDGYLADPSTRTVHVTADTVGGLGFIINETHSRVTGTLVNVPTPLSYPVSIYAHTDTGNSGYSSWASVDSLTAGFTFTLCDGDWTIEPPPIPDRIGPQPPNFTILERPDTLRTVDLVYSLFSGIDDDHNLAPTEFSLFQNFPNPFNARTMIEYGLPKAALVTIEIYDLLGRKIETLFKGPQQAGYFQVTWDSGNNPSGIYFYRLKAGDYTDAHKMLMLK